MLLPKWTSRQKNPKVAAKTCIENSSKIRIFTMQIVFIALFLILIYRLWDLQIVNGQKYADDFELKITRTVRDSSTRGLIYDCKGEILAYNELAYVVTMTDEGIYSSDRERNLTLNSMIYRVIKKLEENQEQINNELKIKVGVHNQYEYTVSGKALLRFQADVFGQANPDNMKLEQKNMNAEELMEFLSANNKFALYGEGKHYYTEEELNHYGLPSEYSKEEALKIVGIRYMLSLNAYKKYVPIILSRDVSKETVAYILENGPILTGIDIEEDWNRVYTGGEAFSHILGYTGKISSEELEQYMELHKDYTTDSVVGKAGVEQYLEEQLQGIDGERQITVNNLGKTVGEDEIIRETISGKDVTLSIDKDLQIAVYNVLEQNLAGIIVSNLRNTKRFDKTHLSDASNIRIPIYDVYLALIENDIICIDDLYGLDATELERSLSKTLKEKEEEVREQLRIALMENNAENLRSSEELQEYLSYIVNNIGILEEAAIDTEDEIYMAWKNKSGIYAKELLMYAIENGWITEGFIDAGEGYFTSNEMYLLLVETIEEKLAEDKAFQKLLFKWLILEDRITGKEICRILYDQQILSDSDEDYEKLVSGRVDAFSFLKKKIEHLEITPAQLALDPCSASAVVIQPKTGKVLALVSYPGYDNNRLANQMDSDYYNQLLNDKSLPLYNRATQQLTAPGSTFKPITIIAGLQEGVIMSESSVLCDGVFDKVDPSLRCWKHSGHGTVSNAPTALQFSCNDYMCEIAYRMGSENGTDYTDNAALKRLQKYSELFYLNKKSGIEVGESQPHVTDADGIRSAIGQGTHNYATVQLARYAGAIASKGDVFSLSLIEGITDTNGNFTKNKAVLEGSVELSDFVWDTIHQGMLQFAQNNTVLKDMQIRVAGKTGTAQEAKNRPDHALFIGYAPAEQPQIAVAVRIANGYGSSNATAVGKSIFNYYFNLESQEKIITEEASQAINTRTD